MADDSWVFGKAEEPPRTNGAVAQSVPVVTAGRVTLPADASSGRVGIVTETLVRVHNWRHRNDPVDWQLPTLPTYVYPRVVFDLSLLATPADYAGAGAVLEATGQTAVGASADLDTGLALAAGGAIDPTTGWTAGSGFAQWRQAVKFVNQTAPGTILWQELRLRARSAAIAQYRRASIKYPEFTPATAGRVTLGVAFTLRILCTGVEGSILARYDGSGASVTLAATADNGDGTAAVSAGLTLAAGGAISLTTGWAAGVWEHDVKLADSLGKQRLTVTITAPAHTLHTHATINVNALCAMIYERQAAIGITNPWSVGDPANAGSFIALTPVLYTYTLTQLKAYVNHFAAQYLADNEYAGGATAPAVLTATYANSATDEGELESLVLAMRKTTADAAGLRGDGEGWSGGGSDAVAATAKAAAASDFQLMGVDPSDPLRSMTRWLAGATVTADISKCRRPGYATFAAGGMTKTVELYAKIIATAGGYDPQGEPDAVLVNQYARLALSPELAAAAYDWDSDLLLIEGAPAAWVWKSTGDNSWFGFTSDTWCGVVEWGFKYV